MVTSTIILANGTELPTIAVYGNEKTYQGAFRKTWEIQLPLESITFEGLRAAFVAENLSEILLTETTTYEPETTEEGEIITREPTTEKFLYHNFSLVKELGLRESQGMYFVELAQRTELEIAQEEQEQLLALLLKGE